MSSQNVDRLSMLPEEIVSHILSLMPTLFALRTSILSKSWRYRWTHVTNINFDDDMFPDDINLLKFGDRVMARKSSHIQLFRLHFSKSWNMLLNLNISKWIDKAVRLNVRELDIDVAMLHCFHICLTACKTLTKLRLHCSDFSVQSPLNCPALVYFPCLKTLDMTIYTNHSVDAFKLINGCQMLETLSLQIIWREEDNENPILNSGRNKNVEDHIFNIPTLKRLKLIWPHCASLINKVVLNVPNLEYLYVGGMLCSVFVMEDLSSLVEASVSFNEIRFDHNHLWVELLKGLTRVKSLIIQNFLSASPLPVFPNLKHLKLKSFRHSGPILKFLESCPELKHLYIEEKQIYTCVETKAVPACMLTNLTTIKFSIFKWWKRDILFLEYILGNAEVLEALTITCRDSNNVEEETRLCAKLRKLPKASRCCEIYFHGIWSHATIS